MSWDFPRRRRSRDDDNPDFFADPFGFGFRSGFEDIDEMIRGMFRTMNELSSQADSNPNTIYYGYQVTVGPDGKPHVREFGNVKPTRKGTFELASRQPFVDVVIDEKENALKVVAEMPGVQKEDINLRVTEETLSIKAENKDRKFDSQIPLDAKVDPGSAKASYNNGILEVTLKLTSPLKQKGVNVKIE